MCIVPKFIIDWFMTMVSLVLKLFVSSRPLKLEGVLCIYILLSMKDKLKTTCMFFLMIWTHVWLSLFHFHDLLFVFIFMLITWLLSFFYQDYIFHAHVLSSLIPAHNAYIYDQDCVGACHHKNYFFCYHLPTRGRAGVKLGDADTSQMYL
jgi:hypothetical protein